VSSVNLLLERLLGSWLGISGFIISFVFIIKSLAGYLGVGEFSQMGSKFFRFCSDTLFLHIT
jgi:hypothetical protein